MLVIMDELRTLTFDEWLEMNMPRLKEQYAHEVKPLFLCAACGRRFTKSGRQKYCTRKCSNDTRQKRFKERHAH